MYKLEVPSSVITANFFHLLLLQNIKTPAGKCTTFSMSKSKLQVDACTEGALIQVQ